MRGDTCIGWDASKITIMADDIWWKRKIKEDVRYRKFRNKDLSLIWFRYDALFSDIAATGERERASNPSQFFEIEGDKSDDPQDMDSTMFLKPSLKRPHSTDGIETSNQVKKNDPTIDKNMNFLANIPGIFERGEMYNYFVNMFLKKDIRQVFLKMPTDEARKSWMEYNYQLYLKKV
ncbi:hypothetical protein KY285_029303 [Solanum tuberosum]|nr:hypothetical protein KY285_029303 [Solanum tuberosum]